MVTIRAWRTGRRSRLWGAASILALAVAVPLVTLAASAEASKHRIATADQFLKATYFPIKLRAPGDPQEIRYDISCPASRRRRGRSGHLRRRRHRLLPLQHECLGKRSAAARR